MTRSALIQAVTLAFLTLPGLALAAPAPPSEAPRALSEAERQAVVLAAEYLDQGPAAWWDRLASTSPLRRLSREAALAEIEVRAGSPAGAEWALEAAPEESPGRRVHARLPLGGGRHPGARPGAGGRRLEDRLAADRRRAGRGEAVDDGDRGDRGEDGKTGTSQDGAPARPSARRRFCPSCPGSPSGCSLASAPPAPCCWPPPGPSGSSAALAIPLGLAGGLIVAARPRRRAPAPRLAPGPLAVGGARGSRGSAELRSLLPLRRALTQAEGSGAAAAPPETRAAGVAGQVAQLWWAQSLLGAWTCAASTSVLEGFPLAGRLPARRAAARPRLLPAPRGGAHGVGLPAGGGGRRGA